jgi:radical SAM/Cys-rich protein
MESTEAGFRECISRIDPGYTKISGVKTLQVNLGDLCNLSCTHCHHSASPLGSRIMSRQVMDKIAGVLSGNSGMTLDITGGAPELHPDFRYFMELTNGSAAKRILRSNLAVMAELGMEWLPEFCRAQGVTITASLPCYLEDNVDSQRGSGVYRKSIRVIKELNSLGYGSEIELNLVYNPGGRSLPPSQSELEAAYKKELLARHGITFSTLYTITNAPVGRFREQLEKEGKLESYIGLLTERSNPAAAGSIMCGTLISVDWQGYLYNCDFNQATGMNLTGKDGTPLTVSDIEPGFMDGHEIMFSGHCYCCTAGEGSSCTGALVG